MSEDFGFYGSGGGEVPYNMSNPSWSNPGMGYGRAFENAIRTGTGGHRPGGMEGLASMVGMMFPGLQPFLPTGGTFSPVGRAITEQRFQDMAKLRGMLTSQNDFDMQQRTETHYRMQAALGIDSRSAAETWAAGSLAVTRNPAMAAVMSQNPGLAQMIERFDPNGSTWAAGAAPTMYLGTRHLGNVSTENVFAMTEAMARRYQYAPGTALAGVTDRSFSYGLNQREMAETMNQGFQNHVLNAQVASGSALADPMRQALLAGGAPSHITAGLAGMQTESQQQFAKQAQQYAALTSSLKDLFGADAPIPELYKNLQSMTMGGMNDISVSDLRTLVDKVKMLTTKSNLSVEAMTAVVAQGAMFAKQIGLPGVAGANMAIAAIQTGDVVMNNREQAAVWGQADDATMRAFIARAQGDVTASSGGSAMTGIIRMREMIKRNGGDTKKLDDLAGKIQSGNLKDEDLAKLGDVQGLAGSLAGVGGLSSGDWMAALTNDRANAEYIPQASAGIAAATRDRNRSLARNALAGMEGRLSARGLNSEEVLAALSSADNSVEDRRKKLAGLLQRANPNASTSDIATQAASLYEEFNNTAYNYTNKQVNGNDLLNTFSNETTAAAAKADAETNQKLLVERRAKDLGIGAQGPLAARMVSLLTSDTPVDTTKFLGTLLGMNNDQERAAVVSMLRGGTGGKESMDHVKSLIDRTKVLGEKIKAGDASEADKKEYREIEKDLESTLNSNEMKLLGTTDLQRQADALMGGLRFVAESKNGTTEALDNQLKKQKEFYSSAEGKKYLEAQAQLYNARTGQKVSADELGKSLIGDIQGIIDSKADVASRSKMAQDLVGKYGKNLSSIEHRDKDGKIDSNLTHGHEIEAIDPNAGGDGSKVKSLTAGSITVTGDIIVQGRTREDSRAGIQDGLRHDSSAIPSGFA
jgi:hypothetical protein